MYIDPFVVGVVTTLIIQFVLLVVYTTINYKKHDKL